MATTRQAYDTAHHLWVRFADALWGPLVLWVVSTAVFLTRQGNPGSRCLVAAAVGAGFVCGVALASAGVRLLIRKDVAGFLVVLAFAGVLLLLSTWWLCAYMAWTLNPQR